MIRHWWERVPIGTRSILCGAHCFFLHPFFVFVAWWRLYGFPWDIRLLVAFVVHDLGYVGKPNMDGAEGERHVEWGANLMGRLFGPEWRDLCLYHSRFYSARDGKPFSKLCVADKYAIALTPHRINLPLMRLTGEIEEYLALRRPGGKYARDVDQTFDEYSPEWYFEMQDWCRRWVAEHRDLKPDTWTQVQPHAEQRSRS